MKKENNSHNLIKNIGNLIKNIGNSPESHNLSAKELRLKNHRPSWMYRNE